MEIGFLLNYCHLGISRPRLHYAFQLHIIALRCRLPSRFRVTFVTLLMSFHTVVPHHFQIKQSLAARRSRNVTPSNTEAVQRVSDRQMCHQSGLLATCSVCVGFTLPAHRIKRRQADASMSHDMRTLLRK